MYYKMLRGDGTSPYQHTPYALPVRRRKWGDWMPALDGEPEKCRRGYHILNATQLLNYPAAALYPAQVRGAVVGFGDKCATTSAIRLGRRIATWNDRTLRLFAADCAERALRRERRAGREPDEQSWAVVRAARAFARGEIDAAALAAARDAARAGALDAAWHAARAGASDAAWHAARAGASDAARAGAEDAAWHAARAGASDAARAGASDAAWHAARAGAWAAERRWQYKRLWEYLTGARAA